MAKVPGLEIPETASSNLLRHESEFSDFGPVTSAAQLTVQIYCGKNRRQKYCIFCLELYKIIIDLFNNK